MLVLALAVRVAHLASKWGTPLMFNDSQYFSAQARQPWEGRWFQGLWERAPAAEHPPFPSILLVPVSWMDDPVPWQRGVTVLTGVVLVAVVMRLAEEVGGRRAALVAGAVAAVYPNLWMNDGLVMSESISMVLVATSLLLARRIMERPEGRQCWWWGLAMGLGVLSRSEVALVSLLLLALVAVVLRRGRRSVVAVAIAAATMVGVLAPWVAFNLSRFERPVLLTTNDGTTLAGANCDAAYYSVVTGGWTADCVEDHGITEASVRSERNRSDAVRYVRAHLHRVPVVVAARLGRTFDLYGFRDMVAVDQGDERPTWAIWSGIAAFWCLLPLAVVGAVRVPRRDRVLLLVPVVAVLATAVLFYGGHRIRSSAEPSLVVLAAVGIVVLVDGVRRRAIVSVRGRD